MSRVRPVAAALTLALAAPIAHAHGPHPFAYGPAEPPKGVGSTEPVGDIEDPTADETEDVARDPAPETDTDTEPGDDDAGEAESEVDAPPTAAPATRPRRYVWGDTEIDAGRHDDATARTQESSPDSNASAPGGYLGPTETKEVAPKDGERKLLVAYIVLPLGTLAMVSGAVATWLTHPDHCQDRLGRYGDDVSPSQCRGLWILNIVRTTYGSMMMASGAVLLGLGLRERKRYREWKAKHGAYVQPRFSTGWSSRGLGQGGAAGMQLGVVLGGRF